MYMKEPRGLRMTLTCGLICHGEFFSLLLIERSSQLLTNTEGPLKVCKLPGGLLKNGG